MVDASGRLLLMKEEWLAQMKAKEKSGSGGSSSSSGSGGHGRNRGRGCGRSGDQNGGARNSSSSDKHEDGMGCGAYHNCGKMGHWARECRSKSKKMEANAAQDDKPALLLVEAVVVETEVVTRPPLAILPPLPPTSQALSGLPSQEESTTAQTTLYDPPNSVVVRLSSTDLRHRSISNRNESWVSPCVDAMPGANAIYLQETDDMPEVISLLQ
jgi:hypothetical protein